MLRLLAKSVIRFHIWGCFFFPTVMKLINFSLLHRGQCGKVSGKCLARHVSKFSRAFEMLYLSRLTQQCYVLYVRTFPLSWEWRDANNGPQRVKSRRAREWIAHRPSAVKVCSSLLLLLVSEISSLSLLMQSDISRLSFIRHCEMAVFQEWWPNCMGMEATMFLPTSCTA